MKVDRETNRVFVYGTLKRGECRADLWPFSPKSVVLARARGALYDLGDYPAMTLGDDWIAGEVWTFEASQMERTLQVLDEIEGYFGNQNDLYRRLLIECHLEGDATANCFSYHYVPTLDERLRILPAERNVVAWPHAV